MPQTIEIDPLFEEAKALLAVTGHITIQMIQREFGIEYTRAKNILDQVRRRNEVRK